ncbi:MAG: nucleotidyltransferase [Chlamydiae bacterium]|nr:nucleotidyltransferase [Chlamydiota bacterium]MBI3277807.1 nucleotidyltransferase [Chlamydiota bacterium]
MEDLYQITFKFQTYLQEKKIKSVVIGGLAIAIWGEPRLTRDIDFKILLDRSQSKQLVNKIAAPYQFLSSNPLEDLQKAGLIFLKSPEGVRIDLLLAETPFDVKVIERSVPIKVKPGIFLKICTPEDLLIYKIISTRSRDHEDIEGIIMRQKKLDQKYILGWLKQFETALDDSMLIQEYTQLTKKHRRR